MKAILLCLLSIFCTLPLAAQERQKDSIVSEITSLERMKTDITSRVDALSDQLTELFSLQQSMKNRIEELTEQLAQARADHARLKAKKELTVKERQTLELFKKNKADKQKLTKSIAEHEVKFNKQLVLLDEAVGLRNETDEKIRQLKSQYDTL